MPKPLTQIEVIEKFTKVHGDKYDYSKVIYTNSKTKVCIICPIHGEFSQRPNSHINGSGCVKCGEDSANIHKFTGRDEVILRFKQTHGDKYDYSEVTPNPLSKQKQKIWCKQHKEYFYQSTGDHSRGQGCPKCGVLQRVNKRSHTIDSWVERANEVHSDKYNYDMISEYSGGKSTVAIICPVCGVFNQRAEDHLFGHGCPKCPHQQSNMELEIASFLKTWVVVDSSNRTIIHPKELDLYIPSKRLAIECNGVYWHTESKGKTQGYHIGKTDSCRQTGVRLIHIFDAEWEKSEEIVKSRLKNILGLTKYKLYGRLCEVKKIDVKVKTEFLNKYHIQGGCKSSIHLGAFYKNRLVAVMTFGKRRFDGKTGFELVRYASIGSFSCVGVAGKLLKYFERNWKPKAIVSYADLRWSEGGLYSALGFKHLRNSSPNYFYIKNGKIVGNRISYQKHKLKGILNIFDSKKTEYENMKANGYDRVWDCGNMVFEKIVK